VAKDLATQLRELEDVEARLRPLVVEARQLYKDMKLERKETQAAIDRWKEIALRAVKEATEDHIRAAMKPALDEELRLMVDEIAKLQHQLYANVEEAFGKVARVFLGLEEQRAGEKSLEELARLYAAGKAARKTETDPIFGNPPIRQSRQGTGGPNG
jgi:hypothetical protein